MFLARYYGALLASLTVVTAALFLVLLWKADLLTLDALKNNKDAIGAAQGLVTMLFLIAGGIFSYYKFFRGRTFSSRAELLVDVSLHETDQGRIMHVLTLTLRNIGTSTIWGPLPSVSIILHGPGHSQSCEEIPDDKWSFPEQVNRGVARASGVDPEERAYFFVWKFVAKDHWAVTYNASVTDRAGHSWKNIKTVSNTVPA